MNSIVITAVMCIGGYMVYRYLTRNEESKTKVQIVPPRQQTEPVPRKRKIIASRPTRSTTGQPTSKPDFEIDDTQYLYLDSFKDVPFSDPDRKIGSLAKSRYTPPWVSIEKSLLQFIQIAI